MNFSFAGGGFLGIYHVGVAIGLKKHVPHLLNKISGASAGAIAACCLLCDASLDTMNGVLHIAREAQKHLLGAFTPHFDLQLVLLETVEKLLPDDAHIRVNGKLHISLTRVHDRKNVIISQFDSREDLLQALLAASFVPVFSGYLPPKYHGIRYMDGGFSDNLPMFDEDTITVAPFCGESDICPRDSSLHPFHFNVTNMSVELSAQNAYRIIRAFLPPKIEMLTKIGWQGRDDALQFLRRRNLLK
ncbi:patatin-like phospholipase domain-containing protein 2 isoform X2 [Nylanderia fulva]|uniref:patatin-like phospholipase domain-containing protein 2 isoform X2 n=1 Tax=Nylanderia fulva TaxID=613905 RepID=UPI0010FB21A8|nr:patatin-like phospholipase domain-containing protein 2 isoform X2 [Nylanderia fulva]